MGPALVPGEMVHGGSVVHLRVSGLEVGVGLHGEMLGSGGGAEGLGLAGKLLGREVLRGVVLAGNVLRGDVLLGDVHRRVRAVGAAVPGGTAVDGLRDTTSSCAREREKKKVECELRIGKEKKEKGKKRSVLLTRFMECVI
jgi:hypothetical protein